MKNILQSRRGGLGSPGRAPLFWLPIFLILFLSVPLHAQERGEPAPGRNAEEGPGFRRPPAYNEDVPPLLGDSELLRLIKLHGPQWVQQSLVWPSKLERRIHAGISTYDQRAAMIAWIDSAFDFRPLPPELVLNAVEMRHWLILFSDWARTLGADAFIMRFTSGDYSIHVTEAATHIILVARPERGTAVAGKSPKGFAMDVARALFREYLLPKSDELVITEEVPGIPGAFEGTWQPGGQGRERRPLAEDMPPLAIRFFVVDDTVAFNINKNVWEHIDNPTLYTERFTPPPDLESEMEIIEAIRTESVSSPRLADPEERIIFYERLRQHLNIRTVEEFLGPMLYDSQGRPLTEQNLDFRRLSSAVEKLNQEQRDMLMTQRRVDTFYVQGLKAFEENDLDMAIDQWSRALAADPLNVRIAVLLQVAMEIKVEEEFGGDWRDAERDPVIDNIRELQAFHRQTILRNATERRDQARLEAEVREMRARGIEFYQQGLYRESAEVWGKILERDPGNATAALWLATLQGRVEEKSGEPPQPGDLLKRARANRNGEADILEADPAQE